VMPDKIVHACYLLSHTARVHEPCAEVKRHTVARNMYVTIVSKIGNCQCDNAAILGDFEKIVMALNNRESRAIASESYRC